ncbi:hypothetical protein D3C79_750020 [compost metagenome]
MADRAETRGRYHGLARLAGIEGVSDVQQIKAGVVTRLTRKRGTSAEQGGQGTHAHPADHFAPVHTACHRAGHPYPSSVSAPDVAAFA